MKKSKEKLSARTLSVKFTHICFNPNTQHNAAQKKKKKRRRKITGKTPVKNKVRQNFFVHILSFFFFYFMECINRGKCFFISN